MINRQLAVLISSAVIAGFSLFLFPERAVALIEYDMKCKQAVACMPSTGDCENSLFDCFSKTCGKECPASIVLTCQMKIGSSCNDRTGTACDVRVDVLTCTSVGVECLCLLPYSGIGYCPSVFTCSL